MVQSFQFTNDGLVNYYYEVEVSLHAISLDKHFYHTEYFHSIDLIDAKKMAIEYFNKTHEGITKNGFFFPVAAYKNYDNNKNACYTINLNFVVDTDGEIEIFQLAGDDPDEHLDSIEAEREIYNELFIDSNE